MRWRSSLALGLALGSVLTAQVLTAPVVRADDATELGSVEIPFEPGPRVPEEAADLMALLSHATLAFTDPASRERFRAAGPYRLVDWGTHGSAAGPAEFRMRLVGRDADGLGAAHLDVRRSDGAVWVAARIREREFLLRLD